IESQSIAEYNEMNDLLMDIISLKNRLMPGGSIDDKSRRLFNMACYNLDTFRSHIFKKGIFNGLNLDIHTLDAVKNDDVALLKLGLKWIKHVFFNNKSMSST
ncbi:MAG: YkgJ family cysteine cluster protein, partial [Desulfobacterales bacterium]